MKISTRGRYALRVMIDLAEQRESGYIPLKEIAERQDISKKYLESIVTDLSKQGIVEGQHGKGGGYKLTKAPEEYTVGEVIRAIEGDLAPVSCLECNAKPCSRAAGCKTLNMWKGLKTIVENYFDSMTVADLVAASVEAEYVI